MSTMMWLAVAVAVVLALAVGFVLLRQRRQGLRGRFGSGYEHSLTEREDRAEAEHELRSREKRFATLDITPLAPRLPADLRPAVGHAAGAVRRRARSRRHRGR
ncbi:hypothetical protein [Nonomuraea angiospora]|uniref:hypothetical protein n=1 Tax=Nonomuraea angiospora TaxID=46172 RepID=UPI0029BAADBA|nr:hypothetical protein [Nonomuraea angiospora]MDX3100951.1 hypothetical protein [Nonomuraea angiospora]